MTIIEALKTGKPIRRPIAKHTGSCRTGWLGNEYVRSLLTQNSPWYAEQPFNLIDERDLMADDWVARTDEWEKADAEDKLRY